MTVIKLAKKNQIQLFYNSCSLTLPSREILLFRCPNISVLNTTCSLQPAKIDGKEMKL